MKYNTLIEGGPLVSQVGFGLWTVSTTMWGIHEKTVGANLLKKAFDLGITFYDTADVYGDGLGETLLAESLGNHRDDIFIATKFGYDFYNHPGVQPGQRERPQDWTPQFVRKACEESLKRLQTDRIDLYQLHNPRLDAIRKDDLWAELDHLKSEGKIRLIGAALGPALKPERQCEEGVVTIRERGAIPQIIFNLLEQPLGDAIFPVARDAGVPVITRVPHASGLLEGTYTEETTFPPNDHRYHRISSSEGRREWLVEGLKKVEKLSFLHANGKRTLGQAAIQYILAEQSVASALPNIYNEKQLIEFAGACDAPALNREDIKEATRLYQSGFAEEMVA